MGLLISGLLDDLINDGCDKLGAIRLRETDIVASAGGRSIGAAGRLKSDARGKSAFHLISSGSLFRISLFTVSTSHLLTSPLACALAFQSFQ